MKNQIKSIISEEFSSLVNTIENDFEINYKRKINNFLLSQMDKKNYCEYGLC